MKPWPIGAKANCPNEDAAVATPSVAGVPKVDLSHLGGAAGAFASGRPEVNTTHIAGSAVSTSSAQIGVNVVNAAGTAWNSGAIGAATLATDTITSTKIAANAIGASELAADAVTEIQSGLATAADLATVAGYIDAEVAAIKAKTDTLPASPAATGDIPTASQNADALLDRADAIESGLTLRKALRLISSLLGGKITGANSGTEVFRNAVADSKDRVTVTVDGHGNRSAVATDLT